MKNIETCSEAVTPSLLFLLHPSRAAVGWALSLPDQHSCPIVFSIHIDLLPGTTGTLHLCFREGHGAADAGNRGCSRREDREILAVSFCFSSLLRAP